MPDPILLCVLAVGAAVVAALAGRLLNPSRRERSRLAAEQRRRAQERAAAHNRVAGTVAVNRPAWIVFWYDHELDTVGRGA